MSTFASTVLTAWDSSNWAALSTSSTIVVGLVSLAVVLAWYASAKKVHPEEPTVISPWVPFVGHLLGMAVFGGRYIKRLGLFDLQFKRLSHATEPIFTLPVPGSRIYVVTEPSLAASVQRSTKNLSFTPMLPEITKRVLGLDKDTVKILSQNLDPEPGQARGLLADIHDLVYGSLGPGAYLNRLSCEASQELCAQLCHESSKVSRGEGLPESVDLLDWIRHLVTVGTARYLFGPNNPIAEDTELEEAFWAFDHGLGGLFIGILPSLMVPEAYRGREKLVVAFRKYFDAGYLDGASDIVKGRVRVEKEYGMSADMTARSALSFLFAGIVNTTTTTFWVVLRLFANPQLRDQVRKEVREALESSAAEHGANTLSIGIVKEKCATLVAVYRESLRVGSENFSVRMVKEDVMLADRYFLKKGGVVQISGGVIHADKSIWGDDVEVFNPDRFLGSRAKTGGGYHPAAFRGFGGGKTLCPGRDFATNEILMFAAMIVHGFDTSAVDGKEIQVPEKNDRVLPVHILEPAKGESPRLVIQERVEEVAALKQLKVVN